jgi:hypothetical protein
MHDHDSVGREVDIELETVRARGHPDVERRSRVLRTQVAPAAMRKYLGTR